MATVFANGRSIVHKGDGQTNIAAPPDVCKTPSPGGPIPIPYVNIAKNSDLADGSQKVKIEGNPVGLENSNLSTSMGDEPGTAGGIISSKNKGKMTWGSSSLDVKVEGKGVVRFMDVTMHNGNTGNTTGMELGTPATSYGADFTGPCPICEKSYDEHPKVENQEARPTAKHVGTLIEKLKEDSTIDHNNLIEALKAEKTVYSTNEKAAEREAARVPPEKKGEYIRAAKIFSAKRKEVNAKIEAIKSKINSPVVKADKLAYMVGVMMCQDHPDKFATASGNNLPGFNRVVRDLGFEVVDREGKVTPENFKEKNSLLQDPKKMAEFEETWQRLERERKVMGAPEPGVCAAQKLLSKKGHQPAAMTEAYFASEKDLKVRFKHIRDAEGFVEATKTALQVDWMAVPEKEYGHGDVVPSCRTCQVLLPFLLCDKKEACG